MKNKLNYSIVFFWLVGLAGGLTSCKKEDDVTPAPVITRVRTVSKDSIYTYTAQYNADSSYMATRTVPVAFDSTTILGRPGRIYAIIGENLGSASAIYFNDVSVYFNPVLVTNNTIIVTIPTTTPFAGSNKLRVVTAGGSVEFGFSIQQPAPVITKVDQLAGQSGDVITITGTIFDNVTAVRFGTVNAEITGKSATQLTVKVPASLSTAAISVTTPGGTAAYSIPFGFKTAIFDDALATGWYSGGWNGTPTVPSKGVIKRGAGSLQYDYTGGFGGFQLGNDASPVPLTGATGIKLSLYGGSGTEGKIVKLVVNGNYDGGVQLVLHAGVWTDYAVPLSSLGATGTLSQIVFQEFSGNAPETIYVDDLGLY
ncbi:IPT/TIG domain-containing protein [Spirosoma flavum]|uniref:IPT/TIG domain-containing protein n=1 Tax=Spirosoma flavum TaxID=2048557 RepID=A0ABW6AK70_9BACT